MSVHSGTQQVYKCGMCSNTFFNKEDVLAHRKSEHALRTKFRLVKTAHKKAVEVYRIDFPDTVQMIHECVAFVSVKLRTLLRFFLSENKHMRVIFTLAQRFAKATDLAIDVEGDFFTNYFSSGTHSFQFTMTYEELDERISSMLMKIEAHFDDFLQNGSGFVLTESLYFEVELLQCVPLNGSCELHTVKYDKPSRSQKISNVEFSPDSGQNRCFYYAIARHFLDSDSNKALSLFVEEQLKQVVKPPVPLKQIPDFEKANKHLDIAVNVIFESEDKNIFPAFASSNIGAENTVNLLMFFVDRVEKDKEPFLHYAYIDNLPKLLASRGVSATTGAHYQHNAHVCFNCFQRFSRVDALKNHAKWCHQQSGQLVSTPEEGEVTKYESKRKSDLLPYLMFFDFECLQKTPDTDCSCLPEKKHKCKHKTFVETVHEPFAYSIVMVDREGDIVENIVHMAENEEETMEHFITTLRKLDKKYSKIMRGNKTMIFNHTDEIKYMHSHKCHICKKPLGKDKVRDHDHITGKFIGAAHSVCNLNRKESSKIPAYCHNFSGYDSHLVMKGLAQYNKPGRLSAIPLNCEKFKIITLNHLVLSDSMSFLGASLSALVDTLKVSKNNFDLLRDWLDNDEDKLQALLRKGVYPYEYMTDIEKVREKALPPIEAFTSKLGGEISQEDYAHAQKVWKLFNCKSMVDYTKVYVQADTLQLAEAILDLRRGIYQEFSVDMCHYISLPMLSKDLMLKVTGCEMELLSDIEQIQMIRNGIRGGLSYVANRYYNCKEEEEKTGENRSLVYLDFNNLYGWALQQKLPYKNFRWMSQEEVDSFDLSLISEDSDVGYILEVDLSYPEELHLSHSSFPLAPHQQEIDLSMISPYAQELFKQLNKRTLPRAKKLINSFLPRKKYVVHGLNLQLYCLQGLVIDCIHRIICFDQSDYIKPYIDICARKRAEAPTKAMSDLYKTLSNSLFGKLIESPFNRMDVKFISSQPQALKNNTDPRVKKHLIFNENLSLSFMSKHEIKLNQSWAVGFSVLELSKWLLQKTYYEDFKPAFKNQVSMVLSDTDSYLMVLPTSNAEEAMKKLPHLTDFSNYPPQHPVYDCSRKNVPGFLKNEMPADEILEVAGVRSKTYAFKTKSGQLTSRCKGVAKRVKKQIPFESFKKAVLGLHEEEVTQYTIQSKKHITRLLRCRKLAFSSFDDKRYLLCNRGHSVPYNSVLIKLSQTLKSKCFFCTYPNVLA